MDDQLQVRNDARLEILLINAGLVSMATRLDDTIALEKVAREIASRSAEHAKAAERCSGALDSLRKIAVDTLYDLSHTRVSHSHDKVRVHLHGEFSVRRMAELMTEIQGHATAVRLQQGLLCERRATVTSQ